MEEEELVREAMRVIGSRKTERKKLSSALNLVKAREKRVVTEEMKEKMRESQRLRREREKAELEEEVKRRLTENGE